MHRDSDRSRSQASAIPTDEYTVRARVRTSSVSGLRRVVFFGLASLWGFIVGVAGLIAAMRFGGLSIQPDSAVVVRLVPVSAVAVLGGFVVAWAYRESRRHSR